MSMMTAQRKAAIPMTNRKPPPSTPGWVKMFGIVGIVLVLLVVVLHLLGRSPGGHSSHGSASGHSEQHP